MDHNRLVKSGHDLVDALDGKGVSVGAAMWVHNTDVNTWKLWLVPRRPTDKREFYRKVADVIADDKRKFADIDTSDTEIIPATHPAIRALSQFAKVSGRSSVQLSNNMLNGFYLTDGIVLLMDL